MTDQERLEKRRAYSRKWRAQRGMKARPEHYKETPAQTKPGKRIQYVYKFPDKVSPEKVAQTATPVIRFCPYCGYNIETHVK